MVRAKKHLGQHFLLDESISKNISDSLTNTANYNTIIEVGAGTGALTKYLLEKEEKLIALDVDRESIEYLKKHYPELDIRNLDFLKINIDNLSENNFAVIGNFPYNISSQILFKILDYKDKIPEVLGMFQQEVAQRICESPGTKKYGIISVLLQAYYNTEYLFTVDKSAFKPVPKVQSAVIRLKRNNTSKLSCNEKLFKQVVKVSFNQRRKMIRNSIKSLLSDKNSTHKFFTKRPEQLSVDDFIELTNFIASN